MVLAFTLKRRALYILLGCAKELSGMAMPVSGFCRWTPSSYRCSPSDFAVPSSAANRTPFALLLGIYQVYICLAANLRTKRGALVALLLFATIGLHVGVIDAGGPQP